MEYVAGMVSSSHSKCEGARVRILHPSRFGSGFRATWLAFDPITQGEVVSGRPNRVPDGFWRSHLLLSGMQGEGSTREQNDVGNQGHPDRSRSRITFNDHLRAVQSSITNDPGPAQKQGPNHAFAWCDALHRNASRRTEGMKAVPEIIHFIGNGRGESEGSSENFCRNGHSGSGEFADEGSTSPGLVFRSHRPNRLGHRSRPNSVMTDSNWSRLIQVTTFPPLTIRTTG